MTGRTVYQPADAPERPHVGWPGGAPAVAGPLPGYVADQEASDSLTSTVSRFAFFSSAFGSLTVTTPFS